MELILKKQKTYEKINIIEDLLNYIQLQFDIDITFDNRETNNYKLIVFGKEFGFNDYNGVINCLKLLITCGDEK